MHFTLWWGPAQYHFVTGGEENICRAAGALHTPLAPDNPQVFAILQQALADPVAGEFLRRLAAEARGSLAPHALSRREVEAEIGRLFGAGRLLIVECLLPQAPALQGEEQAAPRRPQEKAPPPPTLKHWIEFHVVEENTQRFVPEVSMELELPGRGKESHSTEARTLHIPLAQGGTAKILRMEHPESWVVVLVRQG